ncbi:PREDICTED: trihelix transcription factor GT-3a-like [Brassica oleracea var. oleracea]|uniref:Myb-like domain-containing protein n=1 Tax=Brassica oleracea var. oleracea TaxID=109376 RepID=A0A0D3AHE0_BRAOL|nr:PREDICTED: trihelix transcription factor GT-3a-like [Brassica oleracea var. oleracea]
MDRRNPFHLHDHQLYQLFQQQQLTPPPQSTTAAMDLGGGGERIPKWSIDETKELLGIREELDQTFMETKRNKLLWEVVACKMADKGFARNAEQCKSKWKNLVSRYKVCETTEPEPIRQQFPFYNEIQSIFTARMQRMLWSEPRTSSKRKHNQFSSDEEVEEVEELNQDINEELLSFVETHKKDAEVITTSTFTNPKKRAKKGKGTSKAEVAGSTLKEMLEDFMRQTVKMEKEWRDAWEMKAREKEKREKEWQRRMAELEEERAAAERRWMEREDERRLREEARAQKRDTLIDVLLNQINRDQDDDQHQGF